MELPTRELPACLPDLLQGLPVTHRQLESLIRLAEARARLELRDTITREDAEVGRARASGACPAPFPGACPALFLGRRPLRASVLMLILPRGAVDSACRQGEVPNGARELPLSFCPRM